MTNETITPRARLAKITPSSSVLLELCSRFPPPPEWYEEEPQPPPGSAVAEPIRSRVSRPQNNCYCCDGKRHQRHCDRQAAAEQIREWEGE